MNKIFKKLLGTIIVLAMALSLAACAGEEENTIIIGEGDWDSNAFQDQVVKIIIEEGYGVNVDVVTADTSVMISSMKTETLDVCLELWSDNVVTYDEDIANGDYIELSLNFDDNLQGLYVPRYLVEGDKALAPDLKTVNDLNKYPELFENPEEPERGIIYGGPEGWGATEFMQRKMEVYGLDEMFDFKPIDSGATLAATLSGAYQKEEPWVGYYWEPTWVIGLYDMVLLEDSAYSEEDYEKGIGSFPTVDVMVTATPKFVEENPELAEFFGNYHTTSAIISEALAYMQKNEVEADEAAKWFLLEKQDFWKTWVDDEVFNKVLDAIEE
jgi:glycine betaine/proline transport system substrate-binding protein